MTNLSNQVYIYSLSTDVFFTEEERKIKAIKDMFHDKKRLTSEEDKINESLAKLKVKFSEVKKKDQESIENKITAAKRQLDYLQWLNQEVFNTDEKVSNASIKRDLQSKINEFEGVRELNTLRLNVSQVIALFESTLTRKLEMKTNELSEKLIVVEVFNYEIFQSLLANGFNFKGNKYIYFSSSSGQIRDKKAVFILKEAWDEVENTITAGLSIDDINNNGGMSVNKLLAYKSLSTSASEVWSQFNIDKCIVVDDVKVLLKDRTVDYIGRDDFEVTREQRDIELEITDGAGMCLPKVSERMFGEGVYKNFQFRAPWMKGCLSSVLFTDFGDDLKVTDIYGKEWDIHKDKIEVVFFKSQFKMWKQFINKEKPEESWKVYQDNFKKYSCEAAIMNVEEDSIPDAKTNYQYLQSLVKVKDEDLLVLAEKTNDDLMKMGSCPETMIKVLGCDDENEDKNEFQQAINLYPALLNDKNSREAIKKKKSKMLKEAKAGKLSIDGMYTYVLPDWVAVMEHIFNGVKNPKGLLTDGQVSCSLYEEGKVDLLRAPSLSFEHVVRSNLRTDNTNKWFITKAVHISADGLDSKVLQADFDGDKLLVTPSKIMTELAEENARVLDVVPLEYEMGVSEPREINPENIFESLKMAFKGNIGIISNTISKAYNKPDFDIERDYKWIKKMCSYNNHIIDQAKTLDQVQLPDHLKEEWNSYEKQMLPNFFIHAKNKVKGSVMEKNKSTVNRLSDVILNKRLYFKNVVGNFDYRKLMSTPYLAENEFVTNEETDQKIINKYIELDRNKRNYMPTEDEEAVDKKRYVYTLIRMQLLALYPESPQKVADVLVRYLFQVKDSQYKNTLWNALGEEIVKNIKKNVHNEIECADCEEVIHNPRQRQVRCDDCQKKYRAKLDRERKRKAREALKNMSA
jgi:hypothetical protein